MAECEEYNNNIINFTVDLIKGCKDLSDIDNLDATDEVKNSLRQYYNDTFYAEDELVLIYEDVAYFRSHKEELKKKQLTFGEDIYSNECPYFYEFINESEEVSEEERKYNGVATSYLYINEGKDTLGVIEKDNNLYMVASDFNFGTLDGYNIYFEGLEIYVNKYILDKSFPLLRVNDIFYNTLGVIAELDNKYILKNESKGYIIEGSVTCKTRFNKIVELKIDMK